MKLVFLSTYPPRGCGLATFTHNLVLHLDNIASTSGSKIIAVSDDTLKYDSRVVLELDQHDPESYLQTAKRLNKSPTDLLVIEHEYGIFGGNCGEYLLELIDNLRIPFVTTLHTVLPDPNETQWQILNTLGEKGRKIITMAQNTVDTLDYVYDIDPAKIAVIQHGVPYIPMQSREKLKAEAGLSDRSIITTFGLIGPGKGLEYGIEAISKLSRTHPEVLYLILGQTHPTVKKSSGEQYRTSLEMMVHDLALGENVRFVDKYLTEGEIVYYLKLSDIYLTPYLGKDQAVSGTLAYASGYGRVIVSTPYSYAREMLSNGRGLLAKFRDSESIAELIAYTLENPDKKAQMEKRTLAVGKSMMWPYVARQYQALFSRILSESNRIGSDI